MSDDVRNKIIDKKYKVLNKYGNAISSAKNAAQSLSGFYDVIQTIDNIGDGIISKKFVGDEKHDKLILYKLKAKRKEILSFKDSIPENKLLKELNKIDNKILDVSARLEVYKQHPEFRYKEYENDKKMNLSRNLTVGKVVAGTFGNNAFGPDRPGRRSKAKNWKKVSDDNYNKTSNKYWDDLPNKRTVNNKKLVYKGNATPDEVFHAMSKGMGYGANTVNNIRIIKQAKIRKDIEKRAKKIRQDMIKNPKKYKKSEYGYPEIMFVDDFDEKYRLKKLNED